MLDRTKAKVTVERPSKKEPLSDADVNALLRSVSEVVLARGKAVRVVPAAETTLADLRGPTGGFRAPMVKIGEKLLVGFNEETLRAALAGRAR